MNLESIDDEEDIGRGSGSTPFRDTPAPLSESDLNHYNNRNHPGCKEPYTATFHGE